MGRNWYVFGGRHSSFITGYAMFMRYSCMDARGCENPADQQANSDDTGWLRNERRAFSGGQRMIVNPVVIDEPFEVFKTRPA
jgi:hypothetical protein